MSHLLQSGLLIAILIVGLGIAGIGIIQLTLSPDVLSSKCDDGRECTADLLRRTDSTCSQRNLPSNTRCSQCYSAGAGAHCDGLGECAGGDPTLCFSYCDSDNDNDCDNLFAFNEAFASDAAMYYDTLCAANECTAAVTFEVVVGGELALGDEHAIGAARCEELLDPAFYAANKSCLTIERYVAPEFSEQFDNDYDNHACIYRWKCGKKDQAWLDDAYGISATSASAKAKAAAQRTPTQVLATRLGLNSTSLLPPNVVAYLEERAARRAALRAARAAGLPYIPS